MAKVPFSNDFHEVTHSTLLAAWRNDQRREVIENLANRHPAITATFMAQAQADGNFNQEDCNSLANLLMDHFMAVRDTLGLDATERKNTQWHPRWTP